MCILLITLFYKKLLFLNVENPATRESFIPCGRFSSITLYGYKMIDYFVFTFFTVDHPENNFTDFPLTFTVL